MNSPLKLPESTFANVNKNGEIEIIDCFTGEVIAVQKSRERVLIGNLEEAREITLENGRKVWVENKIVGDQIVFNRYVYSELQAAAIADQITQGESLSEVAKKPGFPPIRVIRKWRMDHPEFEEMIELARKDRADMYKDEALRVARSTQSKHDAPANKIKVDALKWAAETDDPATFKPPTKSSPGGTNVTVTLIVDTGIRREPDPIDITAVDQTAKDLVDEAELVAMLPPGCDF